VSVNSASARPDTETRFTRERAMQDRLPRSRLRYARASVLAANRVSTYDSVLDAGAWNARTSAGWSAWPATRKRRGRRAPIPAQCPGTSWTRAPPPGSTRSGGPCDGLRSRSQVKPTEHRSALTGHAHRVPNRSARSKALVPGAETSVSTSANEHPLTQMAALSAGFSA